MTMPLADNTEADLPIIEGVRGRDRYAFEEMVRRHGRWVRGVIFGVLGDRDRVDDVAQQVWVSVWQRIGELREVKLWRTWLYRLSRNAAIDAGREITRRRRQQAEAGPPPVTRPMTPDGATMADERHRAVLDAIQGLPALYREPFVLRHLNGWTYQQIGAALDMPTDSVETRLVRARRFLREALKDKVF